MDEKSIKHLQELTVCSLVSTTSKQADRSATRLVIPRQAPYVASARQHGRLHLARAQSLRHATFQG